MAFLVRKLFEDLQEVYDEGKIEVTPKQFVTYLVSMYWGVRGGPENLVDAAWPVYMNKELSVGSERGGVLTSLVFTPWNMKPLFAILSDVVPLAHYRKRYYMVMVLVTAAAASFCLVTFSAEALGGSDATVAFYLVLLVWTGIASCDTMSQGKYTEICKAKGAAVVTFVSASKTASAIFAVLAVGVINETFGSRITFAVTIPFYIQASLVMGLNFMGDRREEAACQVNKEVLFKDWRLVATGVYLGIMALIIALFPFGIIAEDEKLIRLIFASFIVATVIGLTFWSLPKEVAVVNVYVLMCRMMTFDIRYQLYQWYTAGSDQCPGNPNFTPVVYQSVGLAVGNIATLFGVWLFFAYVSRWPVRAAFWVTTVFTCVAFLFDLNMLTGYNRTIWAGLGLDDTPQKYNEAWADPVRRSDLLFFIAGSQALKPIAITLDDMPATVLLSKLCPVGVETTVFALLAAMQNLGFMFAGLVGARFLGNTGFNIQVTDAGEKICDVGEGSFGFDGISWTVVVGGIILPLLTVPFTFLLLPGKNLDDDFDGSPEGREMDTGPAPFGDAPQYPSMVLGETNQPPAELQKASSSMMFRGGAGRAL